MTVVRDDPETRAAVARVLRALRCSTEPRTWQRREMVRRVSVDARAIVRMFRAAD